MTTTALIGPSAVSCPINQTQYAEKYGISSLTNYIDPTIKQFTATTFGPGKSGLTPVVPTHPSFVSVQRDLHQYIKLYQ
jgi:hypothetical protein